MTQTVRQNRLFAAEDYTVVYESYVNANFQAYDYDTIRTSMVNYVREKYPESYNDWVESAEFVALLDLIAQFGHNLAFRLDMNTRNNFLGTAQKQESILKLAEFLGYQPRRILPAFGHIKVTSISTSEPVIGANGQSLAGTEVRYETTDDDNLDNFITIINAILGDNNKFGSPMRQVISSGVTTQFYEMSNVGDQVYFNTSGRVLGGSESFNIVGLSYDNITSKIIESRPDPAGAMSFVYKNDGKGITSANSGFFFGLKQGTLRFKDVSIDEPISNMTVDVDVENINQSDVWVQTINGNGDIVYDWTRVNDIYGNNAIYNTLNSGIRNVFSVKTRPDNKISVMFPDDSFGNIPNGIIRIWYRVSVNETYVLRPDDLGNVNISIKYFGLDGQIYTAKLGLKLKESVTNASASESMDSIKTNAPRIYATQNRMITAQDYSSYLLSQSENILKIKSINRTHSGHSRYVLPNDPTGSYNNLHLYATDGVLSKVKLRHEIPLSSGISARRIFDEYIEPTLYNPELITLFYDHRHDDFVNRRTSVYGYDGVTERFKWTGSKIQGNVTTGFFVNETNTNIVKGVGTAGSGYLIDVSVGAMIRFEHNGEYIWAKVSNIFNRGLGVNDINGIPTGKRSLVTGSPGAIALDAQIPEGAYVDLIFKAFPRQIDDQLRTDIVNLIVDEQDVNIVYDIETANWVLDNNIPAFLSMTFSGNGSTIVYYTIQLTIKTDQLKFSNITNQYHLDEESKKHARDVINYVTFENGIEKTHKFYIYGFDIKQNGLYEDSVVRLTLIDSNGDNRPDIPSDIYDLFGSSSKGIGIGVVQSLPQSRFEWTHIPSHNEIIDPSFTNIVDVFTLTSKYDNLYREWLISDSDSISEPLPPTLNELNLQFSQVGDKKAMSDKIIYRPVKYKPLFGNKADASVRATFRVIKVPTSNVTDSELKSRIVNAIQNFFAIENWEFGETFYFTELAAYVHKELPGIVGSFVIVPASADSVFGDLFQITPASDELFIPDVSISNIDLIDSITQANIKAA